MTEPMISIPAATMAQKAKNIAAGAAIQFPTRAAMIIYPTKARHNRSMSRGNVIVTR